MEKIGVILIIGVLLIGCSTTDKNMSHVPWYENLNPASEVIMTDWTIFDLDTASYSNQHTFVDDMSSEVEFFW